MHLRRIGGRLRVVVIRKNLSVQCVRNWHDGILVTTRIYGCENPVFLGPVGKR